MQDNRLTDILTKKLEDSLKKDKTLLYEILIEGNKAEIDKAIKDSLKRSISDSVQFIMADHLKEEAVKALKKITPQTIKKLISVNLYALLRDEEFQNKIAQAVTESIKIKVYPSKNLQNINNESTT
jgi:hypothetical protein